MITIAREHPVQDDLALLHQRHTEAMHAETPPESIHMLPADALADPRLAAMRESYLVPNDIRASLDVTIIAAVASMPGAMNRR